MITYSITPPPKQSRKEVTTWRSPPAPAPAPITFLRGSVTRPMRNVGRRRRNRVKIFVSRISILKMYFQVTAICDF